ncbi:hypothetical protein OVA10_23665 [Lelliottia sp. SL45]|nr:hypothetical protein [Lelliottia sp. SL45]
MSAILPKISYPVPSDRNGTAFSSVEDLLAVLGRESSGQYLVGSQGMWHGGIHITDATVPWCALSTDSEEERAYLRQPYRGEQFIRCMADGEIVAWRVCKDYESAAIEWRGEKLLLSTSFVLVRHRVEPGDTPASGLTFYTLYMQLAPFAAYAAQGEGLERKNRDAQRYYASADDVLAGRAGGTLAKDTVVTLSDNIITRHSDGRQFTEVTMAAETKNAAGITVPAGTKVWTVSDRGFLTSATPSVAPPSWWANCSPPYVSQPAGSVSCTARTNWNYYLSSDDVLQGANAGALTAGFPLTYEPGNTAQQVTRPGKTPDEASRMFSLVTLGRDVDRLKKGDRVWVVSDGDSLTPEAATASGEHPVFGDVVVPPVPVRISAGESIGHMGFHQLPEENGRRSRYQVHIECLSTDEGLPTFLTNPEGAGEQSPAFLKYPEGATLFARNSEGGMEDSRRKTKAPGILTLSRVPVLEEEGQPAYYQIRPEGGWVAAEDIQTLSQYALAERGFVAVNKAGVSFDLIDGSLQPDNLVKVILEELHKAAREETRPGYVLNQYNYQRLLEQIDSNRDGYYSMEEYLQAIHIVSYRDRLQRIIAKHASEWYYGKDDALWKGYLDKMKQDAPLWHAYTEAFIDKMGWMKKVPGMVAEPWHMHPVVFLDAIAMNSKMWVLGTTSEHYESGGRGPGVVSSGRGDHGGASYGCYQLSSKLGVVQDYIQQSKYKDRLTGLQVGVQEFDTEWKKIASEHKEEFAHEQYLFIKKTHYEVQLGFLAKKGININHKRAAIHDMIWSTSVQYGPYTDIIIKATKELSFENATDAQIITAVQDYKYAHVETKFSSSRTLWPGLKDRAISEKTKLLDLTQYNYEVE